MDQKKIGGFLKQLRKERALTQQQLAEQFRVSGRTVSRWENGNNMPDLAVLVELADYYDVEIREILEGRRKNQPMKQEEKETLLAVAEYSSQEKDKLRGRMHLLFLLGFFAFSGALVVLALGLEETTPYGEMASLGLGFAFGMMILGVLVTSRYGEKIRRVKWQLLKKNKP